MQITESLRDDIAVFDDFFRPIRSAFQWERHCFDIPLCWAVRSIFDALDGLDQIVEKFAYLANDISQLDALLPQMLAQMPPMIAKIGRAHV